MKFIEKHKARFIFVQYIYSNYFVKSTLTNILKSLEIEDYDKDFLKLLIDDFKKYQNLFEDKIAHFFLDSSDILLRSIILAGFIEYQTNKEKKIIIKEYLLIGDELNSKAGNINKILDSLLI